MKKLIVLTAFLCLLISGDVNSSRSSKAKLLEEGKWFELNDPATETNSYVMRVGTDYIIRTIVSVGYISQVVIRNPKNIKWTQFGTYCWDLK